MKKYVCIRDIYNYIFFTFSLAIYTYYVPILQVVLSSISFRFFFWGPKKTNQPILSKVTLAASGGEGGRSMGAMRWAQTANYGVAPNPAMPRTSLGHDEAPLWTKLWRHFFSLPWMSRGPGS